MEDLYAAFLQLESPQVPSWRPTVAAAGLMATEAFVYW